MLCNYKLQKGAKVAEDCTPVNIAKNTQWAINTFNQWIFSKRTSIVSKLLSKLYPADKLCKGLDAVLHETFHFCFNLTNSK